MDKRDEYVEKLKKQLDLWNAEVSKWETRAQQATATMRAECEKQLVAFRQQRDLAMEELRRVQSASGDAWRELMRGTEEAWSKMSEALDKARAHFQK